MKTFGWTICGPRQKIGTGPRQQNKLLPLLKSRQYVLLSLDHDLGNDRAGTGLDVLRWIEEEVVLHEFRPPEMRVHSMNPVG